MSDTKKQMKIALIGVRPADQITLKGYMRVLLRLDVELVWVAATNSFVDLFIINHEFRTATSVIKLLDDNKGVPVLFVNNTEIDEGGLVQNVLTLPLKKIGLLAEWLNSNVRVLGGTVRPTHSSVTSAPQTLSAPPKPTVQVSDLTGIVSVIKQLQTRSDQWLELNDGSKLLAVIDNKRALVWENIDAQKITANFRLTPYQGVALADKETTDLNDYLWQLALKSPEILLPLVSDTTKYQLRYWAKPPKDSSRRDLLSVMTAMEKKDVNVHEVAQQAAMTGFAVKKIVAALLFSGNLNRSTYADLKAPTSQPAATPVPPVPAPVPVPAPIAAPGKEEKMGFLSRLRRKLGL